MKENLCRIYDSFLPVSLTILLYLSSFIRAASQVIVWGDNTYGETNVPATVTNVIALAAGDIHCLALRADGTVVSWGNQTVVPADLTNVVGIAAGSGNSLALRADGTITTWGQGYFSQMPPDVTNVVALALGPGQLHSLVLRADGTVVDWGNPGYGLTNIPPTAKNIVSVAAGSFHSLALRSDGTVVAWGDNTYHQTRIPAGTTNIIAIAAGWYDSAALRADGTVLTWGDIVPTTLSFYGFTNVVDLVCPFNTLGPNVSVLALRRDGTLVQFQGKSLPAYPTNQITAIAAGSYNALAQVGSGPPVFPAIPVNRTVASGSQAYFRMLAIGAMPLSYQWTCSGTNLPGATNSVLILSNVQPNLAGTLYTLVASNMFGMATSGPVILNETPSEAYIQSTNLSAVVNQQVKFTASTVGQGPFTYQWQFNGTNLLAATNLVLTLTNAQLSDTGSYSLLVSNIFGIVTNYVSLTVAPTVVISPLQNQIAFLGGTAAFNLGLQTLIPVTYQWQFDGVNLDGETNSSLNLTNVPSTLGGTYSLIYYDAYENITNNATLAVEPVAAWGDLGQQSLPPGLTNVIAIACGDDHELALKTDGTVAGWGYNSPFGEATAPPGLSNVIAIAAGGYNSLALKSDGSLFAWGYNSSGQTNVPTGLTNVVAIATGFDFNMALKADGTAVAWGGNNYGQTNVPSNLTNVVAIAASEYCSMALRADGTVFAWGAVSNVPPNVTNGVQIATGGYDDLVLQADGSIIGWGSNNSGQDNIQSGLSNVVGIAIGYSQSAALKTDGTVFAWGANQYGQSTVPTGLTNVIALRGGGYHNLALIGNGPPILQVLISNSAWSVSGFQFSVPSQCGRVYALEYKNSLTDSNWPALPLVAGNGGMLTLTDPSIINSQRFYRVKRW